LALIFWLSCILCCFNPVLSFEIPLTPRMRVLISVSKLFSFFQFLLHLVLLKNILSSKSLSGGSPFWFANMGLIKLSAYSHQAFLNPYKSPSFFFK
jgi:hypothetical protein